MTNDPLLALHTMDPSLPEVALEVHTNTNHNETPHDSSPEAIVESPLNPLSVAQEKMKRQDQQTSEVSQELLHEHYVQIQEVMSW